MASNNKKKKKSAKTLVPSTPSKVKKEVKRILDANMKQLDLSCTDIPFITSFISKLIKEQGEDHGEPIDTENPPKLSGSNPDDFTPERDKNEFDKQLSPETPSANFQIQGVDPKVIQQSVEQVKTWASKLDEFACFLNNPDKSTSLHRVLADGDKPGSVLRGVTRKATDSITRIAGEVEKLKEILNSYLITAPKKLRDSQNTTGPLG